MIRIPLPGTDSALFLTPRWGDLDRPWPLVLLAALLVIPVILAIGLYLRELHLIHRRTASVLLGVRLSLLILLWFVIGLQPMVASVAEEEQSGLIIVAVDRSASMDLADPQRSPAEKLRLANALRMSASETGSDPSAALTRTEIARRTLAHDGANLLNALGERYAVELLGFNKQITQAETLQGLFQSPKGKTDGTDLNLPLARALELGERRPVRALVLLTDGQHTGTALPVQKARKLGEQRVPIYPVVIGSKRPPADIALVELKYPANAFKDTEARLDVRLKVTGIPAQDLIVELHRQKDADRTLDSRVVRHDGTDRFYTTTFTLPTSETGNHAYEVKARATDPATTECTQFNNSRSAVLRVVQDKVRVLVADGEARWEYQYLVNALARDKTVAADRVLFVQPRLGMVPDAELEKSEHPGLKLPPGQKDDNHDPLHGYDCIILGDVAPEHLPILERRRLADYVARRGGTLVVQAGKRFMPLGYAAQPADDPFLKMLPVTSVTSLKPALGFPLTLTSAGSLAGFMQLDAAEMNRQRWAELPRHFWAAIGTPKPGASVLAFATDPKSSAASRADQEKKQGVVVLQNYGLGRVLYVGVESTWRWRHKAGDLYHHRFWGQLVRWAGSDKLVPAGNKHLRYGSRGPVYEQGQVAQLALRLGKDLALPLKGRASLSLVQILPTGKDKQVAQVVLAASSGDARILTAAVADLPPGTYRIVPDIPELKDKLTVPDPERSHDKDADTFTIITAPSREMLDPSVNWDLLQALAVESKGGVLTSDTVHKLPLLLAKNAALHKQRHEMKLWRDEPMVWIMLAIFVMLLGVEWGLRKMAGLP